MKIQTKQYDKFENFYKDISLYGPLHNELKHFIFRGEDSGKYELLPSSLREQNIDKLFLGLKPIDPQYNWEYWQQKAEHTLLREFYKTSNINGLKIPLINSFNKSYVDLIYMDDFTNFELSTWIPDELSEIAALAQHYGTLTRLLDWTFDIYTAIYFASKGACNKILQQNYDKNDKIVIWALNSQYLQFLQPTTSKIPIKFIVPSYYNNPNICAQKGILSYIEVQKENPFSSNINKITNRTPLDKFLNSYCNDDKDKHITLLYKFEIPILESITALNSILDLGYNSAKLFPGYQGVSEALNEHFLLTQLSPKN